MNRLFNGISSIFLILIFLNFLPEITDNLKNIYGSFFENRVDIARIKIDSEIGDTDNLVENFKKFFENKDIKGILMHIESPGGLSGASQALFKEIKSLKQEYPKPLVVFTTNICASGAFYIACSSDHIVAAPSALVGSVGAYVSFFKLKEFIENWKIQYDVKKSGDFKTVGNMFTEITPEMDKMLQDLSNDIYKQFSKDVAIARKLSLKDVDKWANGRVFTGEQALNLKLIDELGSEYNAIKKLKELALIEKDQKINWIKAKTDITSKLLSGNFFKAAAEKLMTSSNIIARN